MRSIGSEAVAEAVLRERREGARGDPRDERVPPAAARPLVPRVRPAAAREHAGVPHAHRGARAAELPAAVHAAHRVGSRAAQQEVRLSVDSN